MYMKKIISLLFILVPFLLNAQASREADSLAVDKACKDYVEGYYLGDSSRIRQAMHAELCKRVLPAKANYKIYATSVDDLISSAVKRKNQADPDPSVPFKIKVEIYDLSYGISTAKISTNKLPFIDYAQLAKVGSEWKVVNVLWAFTPTPKGGQ
jgi:putative lumazine-binding protein